MGIRNPDAVIVVPDSIRAIETAVLSPQAAESALWDFCLANGFSLVATDRALHLFRRAAGRPGEAIEVQTEGYSDQAFDLAMATHDCMEAITGNALAVGLAERAFDVAPGTSFVHSLREDACQLTLEATNAPVT